MWMLNLSHNDFGCDMNSVVWMSPWSVKGGKRASSGRIIIMVIE